MVKVQFTKITVWTNRYASGSGKSKSVEWNVSKTLEESALQKFCLVTCNSFKTSIRPQLCSLGICRDFKKHVRYSLPQMHCTRCNKIYSDKIWKRDNYVSGIMNLLYSLRMSSSDDSHNFHFAFATFKKAFCFFCYQSLRRSRPSLTFLGIESSS